MHSMEGKVVFCKLIAFEKDLGGYTTLVFETLDDSFSNKYIMCVMYPNWNQKNMEIGQEGFLKFIEVIAGVDKWFDGNKFIPYNYSNWQFLKFIEKPNQITTELIID